MKHIKQLLYLSLQFELKPILIIGGLIGLVMTGIVPRMWYIHIPAGVTGALIVEMTSVHRKYKSNGNKY